MKLIFAVDSRCVIMWVFSWFAACTLRIKINLKGPITLMHVHLMVKSLVILHGRFFTRWQHTILKNQQTSTSPTWISSFPSSLNSIHVKIVQKISKKGTLYWIYILNAYTGSNKDVSCICHSAVHSIYLAYCNEHPSYHVNDRVLPNQQYNNLPSIFCGLYDVGQEMLVYTAMLSCFNLCVFRF